MGTISSYPLFFSTPHPFSKITPLPTHSRVRKIVPMKPLGNLHPQKETDHLSYSRARKIVPMKPLGVTHTPRKEQTPPLHNHGYEKSYPCSHWKQSKLRKRKQAPSILAGTKNRTRVAIGNNPNSEKRTSTLPILAGTKNRTHEAIKQATHQKKGSRYPPHIRGYEKPYL